MREVKAEAPKPKKRPNVFLRFLAFLLTAALVLGAAAAVVFREQINIDVIKRYFTYRALEKSDVGQAEPFHFDSSGNGGFSDLGGDLLVWSGSGVRLYSPGGTAYIEEPLTLRRPMANISGSTAVVYDCGGIALRVYQKRTQTFALDAEQGSEILSARVSANGYLTVTSREPSYKGVVTVYNEEFEPIVGLRLSSRFVMDGIISPDGKTVAVLTVGQENSVFNSSFSFYNLHDDAPFATTSLGGNTILDLAAASNHFWALGEGGLTAVGMDGILNSQYDYAGRYLKDFALEGDGFVSLLLGKYRAGSGTTLVTVDADGKELATLELEAQVLDLSSAGRYVSVLTASGLQIYTKDLKPYAQLENASGTRSAVLRTDGSAFLIGSDTARLFVPK